MYKTLISHGKEWIFEICFQPECEKNVKGFANARYKKFPTKKDAEEFIKNNQTGTNQPTKTGSKSEIKVKKLSSKKKVTNFVPYDALQKTSDGYLLNGNRYVAYTDGASTENQRKNSGGSGCGIHWGG